MLVARFVVVIASAAKQSPPELVRYLREVALLAMTASAPGIPHARRNLRSAACEEARITTEAQRHRAEGPGDQLDIRLCASVPLCLCASVPLCQDYPSLEIVA